MSFHYSDLVKSTHSSDEDSNSEGLTWIAPSEKHISEMPPALVESKIEFKPFLGVKTAFLEASLEFDVHPDDIYVCSLPKSGSSWTTTIAWLLTNNLDYDSIDTANRGTIMGDFDEIFNMEIASTKARELRENDESLSEAEAHHMAWHDVFSHLKAPRVFKSHSHSYFLPKGVWTKGARVIYVVRNFKDMAISAYHFAINFFHDNITVDDVVNGITNDVWYQSPQIDHILNYWKLRHLPNVSFVHYEDLVNDSFNTIKTISEFLGCCYTDEQLKVLTEFVSFKNMKKNKAINREEDVARMEEKFGKKRPNPGFTFLRKGKVGTYHEDLTEDQIKKFDDWIEEKLKDSDFRFKC
ncbi:Amine sulfotransferase [Pseudolycoriella hygida]|uniref:Amine sulfotransferase n=1 Tax=Pseudolycoriella hygida TaxID=35572 RepID=A0A9Q0N4W0_9DIPT|nr:Amine sulfotransferase [Pseudolycoriella hygida]